MEARVAWNRIRLKLPAALRVLSVALTLLWGVAGWAQTAGTSVRAGPQVVIQSTVLPSIEILTQQTNLAGTCGGAAFNLNTYIRVDNQASADVTLSAPGIPNLEEFTDETGSNIGPYNGNYPSFTILAFGGGLPPNTPIRVIVNTYTGKSLSGTLSFSSTIQFDCTTGTILNLVAGAPGVPAPIPTLSRTALGAMMLLMMAAALVALRRRSARTAPVRRPQRPR